jgi:hypothetical protein
VSEYPTSHRRCRRRRLLATVAAAVALTALGACGSGSGPGASDAGRPPGKGACSDAARFDPANFVDPTLSTNDFHPTQPGLQWVRGGTTEVGSRVVPYEEIETMTDVIRVIDGVPAIAMLDESTDAGELTQRGIDYLALDRDGDVWLLGGYTEDYEGGEYTNTEDHWLGSSGGTTIGVLAPRLVTMSTPRWCIGGSDEEDPAVGTPKRVGIRQCVEFGCYENVRVVEEGEFDAPDNEDKYYAPGVGVIRNEPLDASLHQDRFELLNFVQLTPEGLAEASRAALDLEAHARQTAPDVFGSSSESRRST